MSCRSFQRRSKMARMHLAGPSGYTGPMSEGPAKSRWLSIEDRVLKAGWLASILLWLLCYSTFRFLGTAVGQKLLDSSWALLLVWFFGFCLVAPVFLLSITSVVMLMRWMKSRKIGR